MLDHAFGLVGFCAAAEGKQLRAARRGKQEEEEASEEAKDEDEGQEADQEADQEEGQEEQEEEEEEAVAEQPPQEQAEAAGARGVPTTARTQAPPRPRIVVSRDDGRDAAVGRRVRVRAGRQAEQRARIVVWRSHGRRYPCGGRVRVRAEQRAPVVAARRVRGRVALQDAARRTRRTTRLASPLLACPQTPPHRQVTCCARTCTDRCADRHTPFSGQPQDAPFSGQPQGAPFSAQPEDARRCRSAHASGAELAHPAAPGQAAPPPGGGADTAGTPAAGDAADGARLQRAAGPHEREPHRDEAVQAFGGRLHLVEVDGGPAESDGAGTGARREAQVDGGQDARLQPARVHREERAHGGGEDPARGRSVLE